MIIIFSLGIIALAIGSIFYEGLILSCALDWFVVPYTSLESLPYLACVGIVLMFDLFEFSMVSKHKDNKEENKSSEDIMADSLSEIVLHLVIYSLVLGIMALVQLGL